VLEYDGTRFCGFQRQPGRASVQEALENKLAAVCGHPVSVVGAGRTDAGVHALGQVVHWDTTGRVPVKKIAAAVNSQPGPDLVARGVEETTEAFHARFSAERRTYHYYVTPEQPSPFMERYVLHEPALLSEAAGRMREALAPLLGRHDFRAYSAGELKTRSTVRTLFRAEVEERGSLLCLRFTADAFLRSMVRAMVGALLRIGRGRLAPEEMGRALASGARPAASLARPHGLFLMRVDYPDGFPEGKALRADRSSIAGERETLAPEGSEPAGRGPEAPARLSRDVGRPRDAENVHGQAGNGPARLVAD
jgi:tRNA pseudouridine38-40 synthase